MIIPQRRPLRSMDRRMFLGSGAAVLAMASMAPIPSARAEGIEPQLSTMGWADYIDPNNIKEWETANNCKFVYDNYASNEEMFSKLQLAQGNSGYDVGMNTDFMIKVLIDKGLIQKLDKSLIPNIGNIRPDFANLPYDPENAYTVPKCSGSQGFIYDKTVITRPMKSWSDFLDAIQNEASGLTLLLDDPLAAAPIIWAKGLSWNTTDESALKDAEAMVETLAKHIKTFNSYPVQDVASGSVVLAQCWNGYARQAIAASGNENLVFVYPEPKSEIWLDSYHLPAGGKSLKAAHSWINFILDPEVAAKETIYTGFISPISGSESHIDPKFAADPLIFPPADAISRGERTERNETYNRRVAILTKFKAAAAQ